MIARINFDVSFRNKLRYCLEEKLTLSPERQQGANRAEVVYYNLCFGDKEALARQFEEVRKQNFNIRKPVLHLVLSLPPGESVSKSRFVDLSRDAAKALDFERHQYVVTLHKDRAHPHVHIVANRIGFDRHIMVNQYTIRRINEFCREAEQRYHLTPVRSMRWYRRPEDRNIPSQHHRVVGLRETIDLELKQCCTHEEFRNRLQLKGYQVYRTQQGIAFKDADGVVIQGYKAGHPAKKIEQDLMENEKQRRVLALKLSRQQAVERSQKKQLKLRPEILPPL